MAAPPAGGDGAGPSRLPKRARTGQEPQPAVAPAGTRVFEGEVPEWLNCAICLGVVCDPVQLMGGKCSHFFCRRCLVAHLRNARTCPQCRGGFVASSGAQVEELVVGSQATQHRLEELHVRCRFGLQEGGEGRGWVAASGEGLCPAVVRVGEVEGHEAGCAFAPVACPYAGCGAVVQRREVEGHRRESMVKHLEAEHAVRVQLEERVGAERAARVRLEERVAQLEGAVQDSRQQRGGGALRVVSGAHDHTVRVWSLADGSCERVLEGRTDDVYAVASVGDGRVVSGAHDHTVRVWSLADGSCERVLEGHTDDVYAVASVGDGRVVSGSQDKTVRVWSLADGSCERVLEGHTGGVSAVASVGDGRVVSGSYDKTIRVWSLADGSCERVLEGHTDAVCAVASVGDGRVV